MTTARDRPAAYAVLTAAGVAIRLAFLLTAGQLNPYADEANYLFFGLSLDRFGLYPGGGVFLWPPGYPVFLSVFLGLFQADGVFAAKLCQVLLSAVVGFTIMLLAERLFQRRVALVAGGLWALHLSFIGSTHYLWAETLFLAVFLPSVYLLYTWWREAESQGAGLGRLVAAGLLLGVAVLIKEAALGLGGIFTLLLLWQRRRSGWSVALSESSAFLLSIVVVVLPWSLRNHEVYGRVAPVGSTLGENCYQGVLSPYRSYDYPKIQYARLYHPDDWVYRWFVAHPPGTAMEGRLRLPNVIDRSAAHVEAARRLARQQPAWFLRSRVKRLANWAAPTSFFVRHYALKRYHGFLNRTPVRRSLVLLCLLQSLLVITLSVPGFLLGLRDRIGRWMIGCMLLYFLGTALLVGMSRHRMAIEPFMLILSAGFLCGAGRPWPARNQHRWALGLVAASWLGLLFLWRLNLREMGAFLALVW